MKAAHRHHASRRAPSRLRGRNHFGAAKARAIAELRVRLAEAEETLRAIRTGQVDAVLVTGSKGPQVFTLEGAEHSYRVLIEAMNEGALTLTAKGVILYANRCFARMIKCRVEQVMGSSISRFLSGADQATLRPFLKGAAKSGSKIQVILHLGDASQLPAQISIRSLAKNDSKHATFGMVVTDMTEARRSERLLRNLAHRLMQAQETERRSLALELHDHITQLLCAILVRSQALANKLSARDGPSKREALVLREMLGQTAEEVERISRNLRPSILDELGLVAALRGISTEFAERTGVSVNLACVQLGALLSTEVELTLYRIVQKALKNVEQYARARRVTVRLKQPAGFVQLTITDDGTGFDPAQQVNGRENAGIGLLRMQERAIAVGGTFEVKSARRAGTQIEVRIPLAPRATAAD